MQDTRHRTRHGYSRVKLTNRKTLKERQNIKMSHFKILTMPVKKSGPIDFLSNACGMENEKPPHPAVMALHKV